MSTERHFHGVRFAEDARDENYRVSRLSLPPVDGTSVHWWADSWWGDQGATPHCVAFSFTHWLNDGPHLQSLFPGRRPGVDTTHIYCEAQKIDEWEGDCENPPHYDGTSIRAGAKVMQAHGFVENYYWARSLDELVHALFAVGPAVIGTYWFSDMTLPDRDGFMHPKGWLQGAHATVVNGVDLNNGVLRIKNSWGRDWGLGGHAYMRFEDFETLIGMWADICVLTQQPLRASADGPTEPEDDVRILREHPPEPAPLRV